MIQRTRQWYLAAALAAFTPLVFSLDFDARLKGFGTVNALPETDIQRELAGTPAKDGSLDLRLMWRQDVDRWQVVVDHSTIWLGGDSFEFNENSRGATS